MKCPIIECNFHEDCVILETIKKVPKDAKSCSYFKTPKQVEKKTEKNEEIVDKKKRF